jgi:hypothetical protein
MRAAWSGLQTAALLAGAGASEPALAQDNRAQTQKGDAKSGPSADVLKKWDDALYAFLTEQPKPSLDIGKNETAASIAKKSADFRRQLQEAGPDFAPNKKTTLEELLIHSNGKLPDNLKGEKSAAVLIERVVVTYQKLGPGAGFDATQAPGQPYAFNFVPAAPGQDMRLVITPLFAGNAGDVSHAYQPGSLSKGVTAAVTEIVQTQGAGPALTKLPEKQASVAVAPNPAGNGNPLGAAKDLQLREFLQSKMQKVGYGEKIVASPREILAVIHDGKFPDEGWTRNREAMDKPLQITIGDARKNLNADGTPYVYNAQEGAQPERLTIFTNGQPGNLADSATDALAFVAQTRDRTARPVRRGLDPNVRQPIQQRPGQDPRKQPQF